MLLADAIALSQQMATDKTKHPLYIRTSQLRKIYKALITGENNRALLKRFVRREDDEAFAQREALTIAITPAVCSALMKPFNKVSRNNKVKKSFDFGTEARNANVQKMRDAFYGKKKSNNRGLDYWLKVRFPQLSFIDPNAWVVIEWDAPESKADVIKPRPFEVTSEMAWNWDVYNEEANWLWCHIDITYKKLKRAKNQRIADAREAADYEDAPGHKFTMYDEDNTIVLTQVDPEYLKGTGYKLQPNEILWQDRTNKEWYLISASEPKVGGVPAIRVGYAKDPETDGQTFVNGFHEALPFLMKSIKTVSEMDLTMSLHTFPQKMQYVQRCPGGKGKNMRCEYGKTIEGDQCSNCKGVGYVVHTSAQDALYFPMPTQGTPNNEILDLEKMLVYKAPDITLLQFQKDYIKSLKEESREAVFGVSPQQKAAGPGQDAAKTATEVNNNMQGVYDALFPYAEKWADSWIEIINIFGILAGSPVESEDAKVVCVVPSDLKMKSIDELLADLKNANEAGAPSFLLDSINTDIAMILYEGDALAEIMFEVKRQFFPFNGQSADQIAMNVASPYVSKYQKILYSNFEAIFNDIELDDPGFWFLNYSDQVPIVEAKVEEYMAEIDAEGMGGNIPVGGDTGGTPPAGGGEGAPGGAGDEGNGGEGGTGKTEPGDGPQPGDPDYVEPTQQ